MRRCALADRNHVVLALALAKTVADAVSTAAYESNWNGMTVVEWETCASTVAEEHVVLRR